MRKLFFVMAACAVLFAGCITPSEENERLSKIGPGVDMYNNLHKQNDISLDPAGAAVRLAMLLSEAEKSGAANLDEVEVEYAGENKNLIQLLFGTKGQVKKSGDDYLITYSKMSQSLLDVYLRAGTFRVSTGGVLLENSSAGQPWRVSLDEKGGEKDKMTYDRSGLGATVTMDDTGNTTVFHTDDGYMIRFDKSRCWANADIMSSWGGDFTLKPSKTEGGLSFSNLSDATFTLSGEAKGGIMVTFNQITGASMSYKIGERPLLYTPSVMRYNQIMGGDEQVRFTNTFDYNPLQYPSPVVDYVWKTIEEVHLSCDVTYNGVSYTYNFY